MGIDIPENIVFILKQIPGALLLTWFNLNPSMDKQLHPLLSVGWNYFSIPKLQQPFENG